MYAFRVDDESQVPVAQGGYGPYAGGFPAGAQNMGGGSGGSQQAVSGSQPSQRPAASQYKCVLPWGAQQRGR
jgi:hypothetical protein